MTAENKICQNCKTQFVIEPEDFDFYKKVSVPPPTFCAECRLQRRMTFRNLKTLYKRETLDDREIFSAFAPDSPLRVFSHEYWLSDKCEPSPGIEYDFSQPFLKQLHELMLQSPWPAGFNMFSVNSEYCNNSISLKNCYLAFNTGYSEDCIYAVDTLRSSRCVEVLKINNSELSYELFDCEKCHRAFFSSHCRESMNIYFCKDLSNCHDCIGCINLRNKQFCIFNKQYSKEEYLERHGKILTGSYEKLHETLEKFSAHATKFPHRFRRGFQNENVTGDYISHSKNCKNVFYSMDLENCAYCQLILFMPSHDAYDITVAGGDLAYELEEASGYEAKFSWFTGSGNLNDIAVDVQYSMNCFGCNYIFGCVGLKNKSYCILNKQFTKEEYTELVPKIIEHMNTMPYVSQRANGESLIYRYGEFFPPELSPFAYNETIAQEYFPLTKEQAVERGYAWRSPEPRNYQITKTLDQLPDHITDVPDSITSDIIGCAHEGSCADQCTTAFRIIPQELQFYRRMNLPLPRLCPNCRHYQRLKQRNPLKLWHRQCTCAGARSEDGAYQNTISHFHGADHCPNEFETSYAPDRPEIVYCEACYNNEVA